MPGARDGVREPLRERYAGEAAAFGSVWRDDRPERDLHDPQCGDDKEVLYCCLLRWSRLQPEQRIAARHRLMYGLLLFGAEVPDHGSYAAEQEHEADDAPHDGRAGGVVVD